MHAYDPKFVIATFHVLHKDVTDTHVVDVYTVLQRVDGCVVMHDTANGGHRQATPVLSTDSAMSYALMQAGWGPLGWVG